MLFTKKMILILMCLCVMIKFNQAQEPATLFECTFNNDLSGDCSFNVSTLLGVPNDALHTDAGEELNINATSPPNRPLSDATSVFSLTKSNGTCAFPSEINGWNLYFCATVEGTKNYTCLTSSNDTQECANGLYAYVSVNKVEGHREIFTSHEISHSPSTEYQCLTFYYFFTNNQTDAYIRVIGQNSSSEKESPIVTVIPQPESKWHTSEVSFIAPYANYRLLFEFFRDHDSSDTDPFFFAIDDISVKTGPCANDPITTTESSTTMSTTMSGGTTTTSDTLTTTTVGSNGSTTTTPSQTTSTPKMDTTTTISGSSTTAGDMGNTTLSSNNFGVIHGLSFGMGILTILMYFIIIV